jgi:hypothetical protein
MTAYTLVQDFEDDEQVFRVGTKPLNSKSAMPPAHFTPQPVMPMPIRIVVSAVDLGPAAAADEPPERLVRFRDADIPADRWDGNQGDFIEPPPPPPSKREQVMLGVRAALGVHMRGRNARAPQVAALLDPMRPRTGQDDQQLDVPHEPMLDAA